MFFFKLISNCCISFHSWAIIDNAMELRLLLPVAPCHLVLLLGHLLGSLGPRRAQLVDVVPIGAAPWSKTVSITRWRPYRQPLLTNTYTLLIKRYESYIFYNLLYLLWTPDALHCSPVTPGDWNFSAFLNWHLWPVKPSLHLNWHGDVICYFRGCD